MAVRRKKIRSKTKRISFKTGTSKKKHKADWRSLSSTGFLKVLTVICVFAALGVGFVFLDRYVKKVAPAWGETIDVELMEPPAWVNQPLRDKIIAAATVGGEDVKLDEGVVCLIQSNLARKVAWLKKVKVQATHDKILIEADYRKPIALVKLGLRKFYVDAELVVLDFLPMPNLPIVRVKGVSVTTEPAAGQKLERDDLVAAVAILAALEQMDKGVAPDKPLLYEIDNIDVSNFNGRENSRFAHIILYTKDNTEIIWGAEIGTWSRHLEAKDEEKLAKLYNYYKQQGSLLGGAKYIDLRSPQNTIPLPIDKY